MPNIDLSILNQRQTPAFFADTLANRPAPSFVGRIFISTDTLDLYRDTGTAWLLLSPSSTGTITGSGAAGQVTYFSGTSSITGSNDLFWDSVNGHLGIGTITPSTALTIFHDQNQIIQLNQTTATNDTKIAFQNSGTPLWRIGNSYNAGANDYGIFDVVGAIQPLTIKKTTGQTYIGAQTTSSGRLVVNDATGDNHLVVIGATAPSIRINNSGSGATKRVGIGIATALNNFIQGAVDRDMCIFNGSTTPSPILFGIDSGTGLSSEAVRISSSRNLLVGSSVDTGQKLQITGEQIINSTATSSSLKINTTNVANWGTNIEFQQSGTFFGFFGSYGSLVGTTNKDLTAYSNTGNGFRVNVNNSPTSTLIISSNGISTFANSIEVTQNEGLIIAPSSGASYQNFKIGATSYSLIGIAGATNDIITGAAVGDLNIRATNSQKILFSINNGSSAAMTLSSSSNLLIGTTIDSGQKLQVSGAINSNGANSGYLYEDRTTSVQWELYASSGTARFFNNAAGIVANIVQATGVYIATSDKNKKKNFETSNLGLDAILKLKPTLYNMISQSNHEVKELGFIAQEVKEVIEQAYVENGEFIGLNYQPIVATLVKAIQELNTKLENLK
jgi:hypothetical protein